LFCSNVFLGPKSGRFVRLLIYSWLLCCAYVFSRFLPVCYGVAPLAADEVRQLRWKETWDLIIHKP
jgi:dolichyl-phosphate-mannose-protein mannosyltransferase